MKTIMKAHAPHARAMATAAMATMGATAAAAAEAAGAEPTPDTGNTAWMIMSTILVLLMSIPGIALFYGGLVRQKNMLSVIMQTLFIVGVVSILWVPSAIRGPSAQASARAATRCGP